VCKASGADVLPEERSWQGRSRTGLIVEEGTDEQLRSRGGLYARLSALQQADMAGGSQ
jgi:hypothetical protein